jgi:hypothetical protein
VRAVQELFALPLHSSISRSARPHYLCVCAMAVACVASFLAHLTVIVAKNCSSGFLALVLPISLPSGQFSAIDGSCTPALASAMYSTLLGLLHCLHSKSKWRTVSLDAQLNSFQLETQVVGNIAD